MSVTAVKKAFQPGWKAFFIFKKGKISFGSNIILLAVKKS